MRIFFALLVMFAAGVNASADELAINPGLWETTLDRTSLLTGKTVTQQTTSCVEADHFDPSSVLSDTEGCELAESKVSGNRLNFKMSCGMGGAQVGVSGMYEVNDQMGKGAMTMEMTMGAMNMNFDMNWVSIRVGDCDA